MSKPKVFVTRILPTSTIQNLNNEIDFEVWPDELPPAYDVLMQKAPVIDGLCCLLSDKIDAAFMAAAPRLKVISQYAVGFDNIDIAAATARHIPVGHTPGVVTEATADLSWALLMAAARRVVEGDQFTRAGKWKTWGPSILVGQDFYGATIGIIGFGRIGQAVARRAAGFGMRILYFDPNRQPEAETQLGARYTSLDDLLAQSDFVSLNTALTPETRHLINAERLAQMKPTAVLANTARGLIIDEAALYHALKTGQITAAGLDVTEIEPLPADSPLLTLPNLIITPHIASGSVQSRTKMVDMTIQNLMAGLKGQRLPYCANPQVYQ